MSRMKKAGIAFGIIALIVFAAYSVFWFAVARQMNAQIDTLWTSMAAGGAKTEAQKPGVSGFPFPPAINFQGSFTEENGTVWNFPDLIYRGFPLPGFLMVLEAPQGFSIQGPLFPRPIELSQASLFVHLPRDLPKNMRVENLRIWQANKGLIPIEYLSLRSGDLNIVGKGYIALDTDLQLAGTIDARITGMQSLLNKLTEKGIMKGQGAILAQNFLQMLVKTDPATNEQYFDTQIRIQKLGVYLGPLRVGYLPEIVWEAAEPQ